MKVGNNFNYRLFSLLFVVSVLMSACGDQSSNSSITSSSRIALSSGRTIYVNSGESIQAAINDATAGDTVQVLAGTYIENISLKSSVVVQGAGAATTTIRGTGTGPVVTASNVDSTAKIDGFTITGGYADLSTINIYADYGGGFSNYNSFYTISNTTITKNIGCGIYNLKSSPTITNTTISENVGTNIYLPSCGIYNKSSSPIITNTTISGNSDSGISNVGENYNNMASSPIISNTTITKNGGAGISNGSSSPTIINTTVTGNKFGGILNNSYSIVTISNSIISGNSAPFGGGIRNHLSSLTMSNSIISGNTAAYFGGGIDNDGSASLTITNSIIMGNTAGIDGGGIYNESSVTGDYNNVWSNVGNNYSGLSAGAHDISADPKFVNVTNGDYRLQSDSPCIDAGSNAALPSSLTTDFYGNPRIADGNGDGAAVVDMGAAEYPAALTISETSILPSTPASNAGRTMPVKFAIRVAANVDPLQPFVHDEGLKIQIYDSAAPSVILQTSHYGLSSTDYRINSSDQFYITNFKTGENPATYCVKIMRTGFLIGQFTFQTVK